jgi:hypothetical protein
MGKRIKDIERIERPTLSPEALAIVSKEFGDRTMDEWEFLRAEHESKRLCVRCHFYPSSWMDFPQEEPYESYPITMCILCMTPYEKSLYFPKYTVPVVITEDELIEALNNAGDLFENKGDGKYKWKHPN